MQSTELIKRYVNAVGENLPKKSRADIQAELVSLLTEQLDARAEAEGRPVDQSMTVAVLREFGEPAVVAQRYVPSRPLIGPAYYPIFMTVIKIVAAVMLVIWAVGAGISLANSDGSAQAWGNIIWNSISGLIGQLLANFGLIVLIFVVMEHFWPNPPPTGEPWDPVKLPAVQNPNRLDLTDVITSIVGNVIVLAIFNFAPNLLTSFFYQEGAWQTLPIFGAGFYPYLPWVYLSCVLEIALYGYVLFRGSWTRVTRVLEIASGLFGVAIVAALLAPGQALAAIPVFDPVIKIGLVVVFVIVLVDVSLNIYRLVTKRWNPPSAPDLELVSNGRQI